MSKRDDPGVQRFHDKVGREKAYKKQLPDDDEGSLPPPVEPIRVEQKPERNDPCPCGSGKKYKKCCAK